MRGTYLHGDFLRAWERKAAKYTRRAHASDMCALSVVMLAEGRLDSRCLQPWLEQQEQVGERGPKEGSVQARGRIVVDRAVHLLAAWAVHLDNLHPQLIAEADWQNGVVLACHVRTVAEFQVLVLVQLRRRSRARTATQTQRGAKRGSRSSSCAILPPSRLAQ
jgi:hypothetical protein